MSRFNFRIGTKLAISAGIGAVFVAAMIGNQFLVHARTQALANQVKAAETAEKAILVAERELRRMIIQQRDIRAAHSIKDLDRPLERINVFLIDGTTSFDAAERAAPLPETKQQIARSRELFTRYASAAHEAAGVERQYLELLADQKDKGVDWTTRLDRFMKLPVLDQLSNRAELLRPLQQADGSFKMARLVFWSYLGGVQPDAAARIDGMIKEASQYVEEARHLTTHRTISDEMDQLARILVGYKDVAGKAIATHRREAAYLKETLDPIRLQMEEILEKAKASLDQDAAALDKENAAQELHAEIINVVAGLLLISVLLGSAGFSSVFIGRPIAGMTEAMRRLASGDTTIEIPWRNATDEIGAMAKALDVFKQNRIERTRLQAEQKEADARATATRKVEMEQLADGFEATVGSIVGSVSSASKQLEAAATTLTRTADNTQQLSARVASGSEEASANVQSVATATDEMTASVSEIARQVHESSRIAGEAVRQARATDARIGELSQAASRIGDVVKLITAIAEQTNLLALNATIEAARAGEAGRGFAVVAQEVKALAGQTAKATNDIGTQIAGMQTATQDSVAAIKEIGGTINRVSEIASAIAAAVEEQGAATAEIARNVQQAAHGTAEVAGSITEVNRGAAETGSASAQVLSSAQALSAEGGRLKAEVEKFLATVRAA